VYDLSREGFVALSLEQTELVEKLLDLLVFGEDGVLGCVELIL
jgi:hypothetical protein